MANFGWAYVNCEDTGGGSGQAAGPTGSLQFLTGANATSGSAFLLYHTSSVSNFSPSTMILSGNLVVTGAVSASVFHYQDITEIDATGSTSFGNTNDDTHMRTGSLVVTEAGAGAVPLASKRWVCMDCYRDEKKFKRWVADQACAAAADDLFANF